ncbi:hypothetical protein QE152_g10325 [Popillia japonica]|uniref:Uncharacterized protein n=1 Tax=Popillia japonica TaxID=7064 RepID=A0AAW1LVV2_POPJA
MKQRQHNLGHKLCSIGQGAITLLLRDSSRFLKWVHATSPLQIPNLWFSTDMENKEDIQYEARTDLSILPERTKQAERAQPNSPSQYVSPNRTLANRARINFIGRLSVNVICSRDLDVRARSVDTDIRPDTNRSPKITICDLKSMDWSREKCMESVRLPG